MTTERARIHLAVLGENTLVEADVETGSAPPGALLGLAGAVSNAALDAARMKAMLAGKPMSCAVGCAHCCRQLVTLAPVEAKAIAALVDAMPEEQQARVRERFRAAVEKMVEIGIRPADAAPGDIGLIGDDPNAPAASAMRRYFEAKIPCPLLEGDRCGIYAQRPTGCREYAVSSSATFCETMSGPIDVLERPMAVFDALLELGATFGTAPRMSVPLALALEWASTHGETVAASHDVEEMFHALVRWMQSDEAPAIVPPGSADPH